MKEDLAEEMPDIYKEVFDDYLMYYEQVGPQGFLNVDETHVTERASRTLLVESNFGERFTTFDFYGTVSECLKGDGKDCRTVLTALASATELLEMYCVNLFRFPWKKEIRTLKTFTGPFVYSIQPVFPPHVIKRVLEMIGYHQQTDTEYRLSENTDSTKVIRVGFQLFLARLECKYLLGIMGQKVHAECVEILQSRSQAPLSRQEAASEAQGDSGEMGGSPCADSRQDLDPACSLVHLGKAQAANTPYRAENHEQRPRTLEVQPSGDTPDPGFTFPNLSEDRSIMEIKENYPDLTFRQKRIFATMPGPQPDQTQAKRSAETRPHEGAADANVCAPPLIGTLSDFRFNAGVASQLQAPETAPVRATEPRGDTEGPAQPDDRASAELTEHLGGMQVNECCRPQGVRYSVEETGRPGMASASAQLRSQAIVCSPSQVRVCSIPDCGGGGCVRVETPGAPELNTITEPPQSFYIPPSPHSPCSHCQQTCGGPCPLCHRARTQPAVDDVIPTYELVESDQRNPDSP